MGDIREADVSRELRAEKRDFAESGLLKGFLGHARRRAICDAVDIVNARGGQDIGDARAFAAAFQLLPELKARYEGVRKLPKECPAYEVPRAENEPKLKQ